MTHGTIIIDTERCKGCGLCIESCPKKILKLAEMKVNTKGYPFAVQTEWENCTGCSACGIVCPDACITVYRKREV